MTDEYAHIIKVEIVPPEAVEPDAALQSDPEERWALRLSHLMLDLLPVAGAVSIYAKAFLETLAKHHADAVADRLRTWFRKDDETVIGLDDGSAAKIVVTADIPDEARIALLDLDVTADDLRGKLLHWDRDASAWRPADDKQDSGS